MDGGGCGAGGIGAEDGGRTCTLWIALSKAVSELEAEASRIGLELSGASGTKGRGGAKGGTKGFSVNSHSRCSFRLLLVIRAEHHWCRCPHRVSREHSALLPVGSDDG